MTRELDTSADLFFMRLQYVFSYPNIFEHLRKIKRHVSPMTRNKLKKSNVKSNKSI